MAASKEDKLAIKFMDGIDGYEFNVHRFANICLAGPAALQNRLFDIFYSMCWYWSELLGNENVGPNHIMYKTCLMARAITRIPTDLTELESEG